MERFPSKRDALRKALHAAVAAASLISGSAEAEESQLPPGVRSATELLDKNIHAAARSPEVSSWAVTEPYISPESTSEERQQFIDTLIKRMHEHRMHNEDVIKHGKPLDAFRAALEQQPMVDPRLFKNTKYDVEHLKKLLHMFVVTAQPNGSKEVNIISSRSDVDTADRMVAAMDKRTGYGNVAFTGPRTMLLPGHVANLLDENDNGWERLDSDVVFVDVPPEFELSRDYAVDTFHMPSTTDVDGRLVVILSIDPDRESDATGLKTFAGFAVKSQPNIMRAMYPDNPGSVFQRMDEQCILVPLPKETVTERNDDIMGRGVSRPISGSSGGLVFAFNEETLKWEFAGNLWAAGQRDVGDQYAIGSINGPDAIRKAYTKKEQRVVIPPHLFKRMRASNL